MAYKKFDFSTITNLNNWRLEQNSDGSIILRSASIGHNGRTSLSLKFNTKGIRINYTVSSEAKYDKGRILIDGSEVVNVSGLVTDTYTKTYDSMGEHTIEFMYSKNGSGVSNADSFYINYLELDSTEERFLIYDNGVYKTYTEEDGWQSVPDITGELTPSIILSHGFEEFPTDISGIVSDNPQVFFATAEECSKLNAVLTYTDLPLIQTVDFNIIGSISSSQTTYEITGDSDIKWIVSTDLGETWKAYDESLANWKTVENSHTLETLYPSISKFSGISADLWNQVVGDTARIRFAFYFIHKNVSDKCTLTSYRLNYT